MAQQTCNKHNRSMIVFETRTTHHTENCPVCTEIDALKEKIKNVRLYYSIWDNDGGAYINTGLNSETREECINDGVGLLMEGMETKDRNILKKSDLGAKEKFLNAHSYYIHSHDEVMGED